MNEVMGSKEDGTKYITIFRDPVDLFESAWGFYSFETKFGISLEEFALRTASKSQPRAVFRGEAHIHQILWDLGIDDTENKTDIREKIKEVENSFNLIMMVERFEESLILMKNELCWDYTDITSLKLNGRVDDVKTKLNATTRALLKDFLQNDYQVYNHFYKIFENKVKQFGQDKMKNELGNFYEENDIISKRCGLTEGALVGDPRDVWGGKAGLQGYKTVKNNDSDCLRMTLRERTFVDQIRINQLNRLKGING